MDKYAELKDILKRITQESYPDIIITTGEVVSIEGDTCTVKIDDMDIEGVRLCATKDLGKTPLLITPKVGSFVLIGSLSGDLRELAVLNLNEAASIDIAIDSITQKIDKDGVVFNGGEKGGMVIAQNLVESLNKINDFINAFKQTLSVPVNETGNGAPSQLQIALQSALQNKTLSDYSDIEDSKVKH